MILQTVILSVVIVAIGMILLLVKVILKRMENLPHSIFTTAKRCAKEASTVSSTKTEKKEIKQN